jgi:hypothetical protein
MGTVHRGNLHYRGLLRISSFITYRGIDRPLQTGAVQQVLVGQFRTAGGLVLLSGGSWGLRFPAARTGDRRPGRMIVTERLQAAN